MAAESGCYGLFIGFESISQKCLEEISKKARVNEYKSLVKKIHDYGISIEGSFIFGFDHDEKGVAKATVNFANDLDLDAVQFVILTPFPGTKLFKRLQSEGRILTYDWSLYDVVHVVFQPKHMDPEELESELFEAYEMFYGFMRIFSRISRRIFSRHPIHLLELARMNLGFRFGFRRPKLYK